VLDDLGRSDFKARARRRSWVTGADPVVFCAFDLLAVNGRPLIALPVEERKRQLEQLLTPADLLRAVRRRHMNLPQRDRCQYGCFWQKAVVLQCSRKRTQP
jgi:ATP-dependent DNA ligase